MRINRLRLTNFKGFRDFDQRLNRRFTLVVGGNGTGKSSLLDALSVAFGSFLLGIPNARSRTIQRNEVFEEARDYNGALDFIQHFPVVVEAEGLIGDGESRKEPLKWRRELGSLRSRTTSRDAALVKTTASSSYESIVAGQDVALPLLSYYGTGRLWEEPRRFPSKKRPSRFDAYRNSHEARVSSADLIDWLKKERFQELERDTPSMRLKAWRTAVESCFDEDVFVSYTLSRERIEVKFSESGKVVSYDNLSHGQRNVLSMIGDIAFKAIILNPQLEERAASETNGIILIDEIDLHLHPKWQRLIIPALLKSFPRLQFFATTHSPFVVQSLVEGSLLNLDDMETDDEVYNLDIMEIAKDIQKVEVPEKSAVHLERVEHAKRFMLMAESTSAAHDGDQREATSVEMNRILEREIDDPGLAALLKIKQMASKKE